MQRVCQALKGDLVHKIVGRILILQIKHLLGMFERVDINHIYREVNRCANELAKMGKKFQRDMSIFESVPNTFCKTFEEDARGLPSFRSDL